MNKKQLIVAWVRRDMRKILVLLLCLGLWGCETLDPYHYTNDNLPYPSVHNKYTMTEIISEPPGAKIEINNQYIGDTPLTLHINRLFYSQIVFGNEMGYWERLTITAYPIFAGQYTQTKYIGQNEATPTKVYFNMNLTPQTPEYNINIQNK